MQNQYIIYPGGHHQFQNNYFGSFNRLILKPYLMVKKFINPTPEIVWY